MKKFIVIAFVGILIISIVGFTAKTAKSKQTEVEEKALGIPVETVLVKAGPIQNALEYSGTLRAKEDIVISSKIAARIEKLAVEEGDFVKEGQQLYLLDQAEFKTKIDSLEQKVHTAELNASFWEQQTLDSLKQKVFTAQINFEHWEKQYDTYSGLYKAGVISEESLRKIQLSRDTAESGLKEAKMQLEDKSKNDAWMKDSSKSNLQEVRLLLNEAKVNLENTVITAPTSGVVTSVQTRVGEMASPGKPLITLASTDELKVQAKVFEKDLKSIGTETEVIVNFPNLKIDPIKTKVSKIYPSLDPGTRATIVEAVIPKEAYQQELLKPGMGINMSFVLESKEKAVLVPEEAVAQKAGKFYLYIANGEKAVHKDVTVGIRSKGQIEILTGIKEGDKVVVGDLTKLYNNRLIYPVGRED